MSSYTATVALAIHNECYDNVAQIDTHSIIEYTEWLTGVTQHFKSMVRFSPDYRWVQINVHTMGKIVLIDKDKDGIVHIYEYGATTDD